MQNGHEGWLRWTTNLAVFGFGISAVGYLLDIEKLQNIANVYVNGDAAIKALLTATWKSSLDEQGFWGYGAVGAWMLVVSLSGLRTGRLPRLLCFFGLARVSPQAVELFASLTLRPTDAMQMRVLRRGEAFPRC